MKNTNAPAFIITDSSVTVIINGNPLTMNSDNANYNNVVEALADGRYDCLEDLFDSGKAIASFAEGNFEITDSEVRYKGESVHNHVVDRILTFMQNGLPYKPLLNFLDKLMQNPSKRAVDELYGFLEASKLPITEDGDFLAYRKVTNDYRDFYTGKFDNRIGSTVEMPRNKVDEDKEKTCSMGLHFCAQSYLSQYHGGNGKVVIVKISPSHVVAIPADYANAKGRCCKMVIFADCVGYEQGEKFDSSLYSDYDDSGYCDEDCEEDCEECVLKPAVSEATRQKLRKAALRQKRDLNGKFV